MNSHKTFSDYVHKFNDFGNAQPRAQYDEM